MAIPDIKWNPVTPSFRGSSQQAAVAGRNLEAVGRTAGDILNRAMAERKQEDLLAQQGIENARAKKLLNMKQSEFDRTMAEKTAEDLANAQYMDVTPNKILTAPEKTTIIPGTPGTEGLITDAELSKSDQIGRAADKAMRLEKLLKGEGTSYNTTLKDTLGIASQPVATKEPTVPYTDPTYKYAGQSKALREYMTAPEKPAPDYKGLVSSSKGQTSEERKAALEAERQKQLSKIDELTKEVVSGYKAGAQASTKDEKVVTPAEYKFKAPSREEFNKSLLAQARKEKGAELTKVEKGAIGKRAETLFNRSEDLALKNMELLARQARGTPRETAYDRELGRLRAQKLMGVLDKGNKGYDKVSEFAESMYTMFPDDPNRVAQYIEDNEAELSKMSKQNLKARVAEFKSREGRESGLDPTDWWFTDLGGGTKIGDVLDSTVE